MSRDYESSVLQGQVPDKFYTRAYNYRTGSAITPSILTLRLESTTIDERTVPKRLHVRIYDEKRKRVLYDASHQASLFFYRDPVDLKLTKQQVIERIIAIFESIKPLGIPEEDFSQ